MKFENVVPIGARKGGVAAKEYAVLFRLTGEEVQFKLFAGELSSAEMGDIADAFEAAARSIRRDKRYP